jgi:hypothetical protein
MDQWWQSVQAGDSGSAVKPQTSLSDVLKKRRQNKQSQSQSQSSADVDAPSYARGGRVRKTGLARLHKGERVLTRKQARRYRSK